MSEWNSVKERSGELARNVVLRSYLGSGAFVRAAFPTPEDTMSQARISSLDAPELVIGGSSSVVALAKSSSHAEHHFAPSTRIDRIANVSSCGRVKDCSGQPRTARSSSLSQSSKGFVPSEDLINKTMERIASQTRLDGQLLHGAPALEWPQVSNIAQEGCLMDMTSGGQDEQVLKKQIEELRRTKEALLFQRDNNRRRGQYVLDTIYEENQQMLRQLDDLRSEYEIFAESTKNMQELFASRELVLRTVRATAEQAFQTETDDDLMRIQILDVHGSTNNGSICRDDQHKVSVASVSDIVTSPSPGRCRGRRARQQIAPGLAMPGRSSSRPQLNRLVDVDDRIRNPQLSAFHVGGGIGRSDGHSEDMFRCRSAECIR